MASTDKIAPLPETLPEDFGEWDGESSPAPSAGKSDEWETTFGHNEAAKPHGQSDYLEEILSSFESKSRVWRSDSQGSNRVKQENRRTEWQNEAAAAPAPANGDAERHAEPKTVLSPALDAPVDAWPDLSEPVFAKPHKATSESTQAPPNPASNKPEAGHARTEAPKAPSAPNAGTEDGVLAASEPSKESIREADNALFQIFSGKNSEFDEEPKKGRNKRLIVVAAGAGAILLPLILIISLGHHGTKAAVRVPVQPSPAATDTQVVTDAPESLASQPSTQDKPAAATKKEQASDAEPAQKEEASNSSQPASELQTQMMNDQLTAPRMISGDMKKQVGENAPPPASLGASAAEGLGGGGAMASVFDGHTQPIVKAARPIAISSGVATGMLVQRTPPIYPTIAKAARVSGTVELQATISKTGAIKDVHVVNGPVMLRQSALDAVRTWRYKPYKLNNQPTEVETIVNVVFTLGN